MERSGGLEWTERLTVIRSGWADSGPADRRPTPVVCRARAGGAGASGAEQVRVHLDAMASDQMQALEGGGGRRDSWGEATGA